MKQLTKSFFERETVEAAKELLGKVISVNGVKGRIVETEAYGSDPASHAFKRTERSSLMFDSFGSVYVYLIYGMYHCLNFTTNSINKAGAVLIRAVEPVSGIEKMKERRNTSDVHNLCSGPGKLCSALGIDKSFNGLKLGKEIKVYDDGFKVEIEKSSRIGIKDALDLPWRFFIRDNKFVSK
jgi:DNA-3-methyladenine glycosylase